MAWHATAPSGGSGRVYRDAAHAVYYGTSYRKDREECEAPTLGLPKHDADTHATAQATTQHRLSTQHRISRGLLLALGTRK